MTGNILQSIVSTVPVQVLMEDLGTRPPVVHPLGSLQIDAHKQTRGSG